MEAVALGAALEKLIDRTIALVREREIKRSAFFRELIEPVHASFTRFREEHLRTFGEVRVRLRDGSASLTDLYDLVEDKSLLESRSWSMFDRLEQLAAGSRARVGEEFIDYARSLAKCLARTDGIPNDIMYYRGIRSRLAVAMRGLERANWEEPHEPEAVLRERLFNEVESLLIQFNEYTGEVEAAYLRLRNHCLV